MAPVRRQALMAAAATLIAALPEAATATAQTYSAKPVKIIVGFLAGGPLDAHARLLADKLGSPRGQPMIVDDKAGASGTVGAGFVAKSDADGHKLLMTNTGTMVVNPAVYSELAYQALKNFAPVARTAQQPLALVVNPAVPARSVAGIKGFEVVGLHGVPAPAGTPRPVLDKLAGAFKAALESPEIRSRKVQQAADPVFLGPEQFARFVAAEMPGWALAVKASGARLD